MMSELSTCSALAGRLPALERAPENAFAGRWQRIDWLLLAAATALAAFLRWYELGSVPPGFYHDEAINGLAGRDILQGRLFLLYGFDVREPLFHWLVAAGQLIFGNSVVAVRSAAALAGTLTVPALYLLGRKLFERQIAVFAAFGLAASFWHLELSRFGVRAVTLPAMMVLTFYFLWVGAERSGRRWPFVAGGLCLGLTAYTYISSRAVPLLLGAFLLWQIRYGGSGWRRLLKPYSLVFLSAALVFAPLGWTFLRQPELFSARSGAVSLLGTAGAPQAIAESAVRTLGMFFVAGDANLRHNYAGWPVFDPIGALLFLGGVAGCLRRWRQPACAFLGLWLAIMLLPGVLSSDSPHYIRTLGAAPAAYLIAGVGAAALRSRLASRLHARSFALGLAGYFLALAAVVFYTYFGQWARAPATASAFESELAAPARYLAKLPPGPAVLLYSDGYTAAYPQVFQYLSEGAACCALEGVSWYEGNGTLVVPPGQAGRIYAAGTYFVVLGSNLNAERLLDGLSGMDRLTGAGAGSQQGEPGPFTVFQARTPVQPWTGSGIRPSGLIIGGKVSLEGYAVESGVVAPAEEKWQAEGRPGDVLRLRVVWHPLGPAMQPDLRLFVHLVDVAGRQWAGRDVTAFPSAAWEGGELVTTWIELPIPEDVPPGKYELRAGMYSYASKRRLPISNLIGRPLGDEAGLLQVRVAPPPAGKPNHRLEATLENGSALLGYDLQQTGDGLHVTLYWQAGGTMPLDYTVFVHLTDSSGLPVEQHDGQPANGAFPSSYWAAGDVVRDEHVVPLSPFVPPGRYLLRAGMYDAQTGRRVLLKDGGDAVSLGEVAIP